MQRNPHSYQIATGYRTFYSLSLIYQPITKKRLFFLKKIELKNKTQIGRPYFRMKLFIDNFFYNFIHYFLFYFKSTT